MVQLNNIAKSSQQSVIEVDTIPFLLIHKQLVWFMSMKKLVYLQIVKRKSAVTIQATLLAYQFT